MATVSSPNLTREEQAQQSWPAYGAPLYGTQWCDHLRASCLRRLQGGFRMSQEDPDGPPELLLSLWWDPRFWLENGRLPTTCSDGRLMTLAAAARVRVSIDCLGRGMEQMEPGMLAEDACPNWPCSSVAATFPDFFKFKGSFLDKKSETEPRSAALRPAIVAYKAGRLPELNECFVSLLRLLSQASVWTAVDSCDPQFLANSFGGGTDYERVLGTMGDFGCTGPDLDCCRVGLGLKLDHVSNHRHSSVLKGDRRTNHKKGVQALGDGPAG